LHEILKHANARFSELREQNGHATVMKEVREYIDEHYANWDLSLTLLSSEFNLNSKTLSRLFKEHFGENFVDYLMKHRIEQAKSLLLQSEMPIYEISCEVGYGNSRSFTRAFKKLEGV